MLSNTVRDEFISLIGSEVKKCLISEIREAVYFSIIVDSALDITHIDQLTLILIFVDRRTVILRTIFWFFKYCAPRFRIFRENHIGKFKRFIIRY